MMMEDRFLFEGGVRNSPPILETAPDTVVPAETAFFHVHPEDLEVQDLDRPLCKEGSLVASFLLPSIVRHPFTAVEPNRIYSPHTVFMRQSGNSYEIATALCSLLLGLNYNAFVVSGYATRDVAQKIMMRVNVPFPPIQDEEAPPEEQKPQTKYQMKPANDLRSKFLLAMAQREIDKVIEMKRREEEAEQKRIEKEEQPPFDELYGQRVHAWVLLLNATAGERDVPDPIFIEPSTGYSHPLDSNLYCGIESLWNNTNYWINLQDCTHGLGKLSYDFQDLDKWEHLLPGEPLQFRDMVFDDSLEEEEIKQLQIQDEKHLDMPTPWSLKIHIPVDQIKKRFPNGVKKTWYKRCLVEQFSEFVQEDGLVTRVCRYTDMDCSPSELKIIEEHYANRADKLEKIKSDCLTGLIAEYFASGREDSVKKHTYYGGHTSLESVRTIEYYHKCRYDGLAKLELDPVFITEHYINREDKLYYRNISFARRGDPPPGMIEGPRRITIRISEKYHRNPTKKASEDIETRDLDIIEREIHLKYQYDTGSVTASTRDYFKPPLAEMGDRLRFTPELTVGYQAEIGARPARMLNLFLLFEKQLAEEEEALHRVREKEDDIMDFMQRRALETANPALIVSMFEQKENEHHRLAMLQKEQEEREHREHEVEEETDYLGPYLAKLGNPEELTFEQATTVYRVCLSDFKQLLIDRANDIQSQFELMSHLIQEEQSNYIANQDDLTAEEERKYFETVNDCTFYLHTLEMRLARQRDLSSLRYDNILCYLRYDPRLQILRPQHRSTS